MICYLLKKNQFIRYFSILIVFIFTITSCSTLPKPDSDVDTLLMIPIKTDKKSSRDWFGKYRITIKDLGTEETVKTVLLPVKNGFFAIRGLSPGSYYISRDTFVYNRTGKTGNTTIRFYKFELYPNKMTILNYSFLYTMIKKTNGTSHMNREWVYSAKQDQKQYMEELSGYKNFSLWNNNFIEVSSQ